LFLKYLKDIENVRTIPENYMDWERVGSVEILVE
jgi:hypothetical protein